MRNEIKERPKLREFFVREDIRPYPSPEDWDGRSIWRAGRVEHPSAEGCTQVRKMILEGFFDNPVSD